MAQPRGGRDTPGIAHHSHGAVALQDNALVLSVDFRINAPLPHKLQGLLHQHNLLIKAWLELYGVSWPGLADGFVDALPCYYPREARVSPHPLPSFAYCTQMKHTQPCRKTLGEKTGCLDSRSSFLVPCMALRRSRPSAQKTLAKTLSGRSCILASASCGFRVAADAEGFFAFGTFFFGVFRALAAFCRFALGAVSTAFALRLPLSVFGIVMSPVPQLNYYIPYTADAVKSKSGLCLSLRRRAACVLSNMLQTCALTWSYFGHVPANISSVPAAYEQ